jgi:hypothetical protein
MATLTVAARIELSLRKRGLPATAARFGLRLGGPSSASAPPVPRRPLPSWAVRRARLAVALMRWWPFGDTCLRKSLVIGNRLADLSPQLFIGVPVSGGQEFTSAHAWLQINGIDIDPTSANYVAFDLT